MHPFYFFTVMTPGSRWIEWMPGSTPYTIL